MLTDALHNWVAIIVGLLGISGIAGAAFTVVSSNYSSKTIQNLKEYISSLEESNKLLKSERADLLGRVITLEGKVKTLQDQVTNPPQITALTEKIVLYHKEVSETLLGLTHLLKGSGHARGDGA